MAIADYKQTIFGTVIAIAAVGGATYVSTGRPSYIMQGQIEMSQNCEAGICPGTFVGVVSGATAFDAGQGNKDASTPAQPDAAPLPPKPDASTPASDAAQPGRPDAMQADASPVPPAPDAGTPGGQDGSTSGGLPNIGIYAAPGNNSVLLPVATLPVPFVGSTTLDPTFGVSAKRIMQVGMHDYSQLQAFSSDNKLILLIDKPEGHYVVYNWPSMTLVRTLAFGGPRWIPGTHKLIYFDRIDSNSPTSPSVVKIYDVDSNTSVIAFTFNQPYNVSSRVQEEMSYDGRWTPSMVHNGTGNAAYHVVAVDIINKAAGADILMGSLFTSGGGTCAPDAQYGILLPDYVAVDPLGKYLAFGWARDGAAGKDASGNQVASCSGVELYDMKTGAFIRHIYDGHQHGDYGMTTDGREFYLTVALNTSDITIQWLDGGMSTRLRGMSWGSWGHVSCQGPNGYCLVSGYDAGVGDTYVGFNELYLISTKDGALRRIYHHRATACTYWQQPRASMSKDGRYVIFDSDWGTCSNGPAPYVIDTQAGPFAEAAPLSSPPAPKQYSNLDELNLDIIAETSRRRDDMLLRHAEILIKNAEYFRAHSHK